MHARVWMVAGLVVCGLQAGCKLPARERLAYPPDPLLLSKKPSEEKSAPSEKQTQWAAGEPATPPFPAATFASRRRPALPSDVAVNKTVPAQPTALPGGKVTLIPAIRSRTVETHDQADDLSWLQGTLEKHHEGYYHLRFADPTAADPWGGKVRLEDDPRLELYQDGDLVRVGGAIVPGSADRPARFVQDPHYRIRSIQLLRSRL
jgi:hypothetical protein